MARSGAWSMSVSHWSPVISCVKGGRQRLLHNLWPCGHTVCSTHTYGETCRLEKCSGSYRGRLCLQHNACTNIPCTIVSLCKVEIKKERYFEQKESLPTSQERSLQPHTTAEVNRCVQNVLSKTTVHRGRGST